MGVPVYHGDFYPDDFILNPTQGYADLRALEPVFCIRRLYRRTQGIHGKTQTRV